MCVNTYVCMYIHFVFFQSNHIEDFFKKKIFINGLYVNMYVCMHIRKYVCMYLRMYVCMCVCIYIRMYVCIYIIGGDCGFKCSRLPGV